MVVPPHGSFPMENTIQMDDDWGYPYARIPPCIVDDVDDCPTKNLHLPGISGSIVPSVHGKVEQNLQVGNWNSLCWMAGSKFGSEIHGFLQTFS